MRPWFFSLLLVGCATTAARGPAAVRDAVPVTPFESELGVAELGRGIAEGGPAGLRCVLGSVSARAVVPHIVYFLKHEGSYRRNVYDYGIAIVVGESSLESVAMNPEWTRSTFRSELAEHCGHKFLAGEQVGVMIARQLDTPEFPANEPELELFGSLAELEARVAGIKSTNEVGFELGYVDTPGGVVSRYNGDTSHGLMSMKDFESFFWSHPTPETSADLRSSNARVGVLLQSNP